MPFFPASGFGEQSKYYDDDILLDGTYQIVSVTIDASSTDDTNAEDTTILRKGLLLVKSSDYSNRYIPLSTADGYINGTPTQFMKDVVVLAREERTIYTYILGGERRRTVTEAHRVVPAYIACNIFTEKVFYNNKGTLALTTAQLDKCQRIKLVDTGLQIYDKTESLVRALLVRRTEITESEIDFN